MTRYFEFLQKAADVNRGSNVNDRTDTVADLIVKHAQQVQRSAKD